MVLVGLGFGRKIVDRLLDNGGNPHVTLIGICDMDREKCVAVQAQYTSLKIYDDLDAVLADDSVQSVGLFTRPNGRAALLSKIIRAGKDVMTTKPFEVDVDAATAVLDEAEQCGRVIHLNSPTVAPSPAMQAIHDWKKEFDLGAAVAARADVWTHYRDQADGSWYDDPQRCPVAPVFRLGIYLINDLVQLFGRARRVNVLSTRLHTGRPTADNAQLGIEFENGALANIFASFCVRDGDHYRNSLTVNYERGTIFRDVGTERIPKRGAQSLITNADVWAPRQVSAQIAFAEDDNDDYNWSAFAAAVHRQSDAPTYDKEHILEPLRIVNAMALAEQTGQTTQVQH